MSDQFHQLSDKWTISEKYTAQNKDDDYKKTIVDICSIRSVEEFAFIMKQTIYQSLTELFSEPQKQKQFKNFKNSSIETQIEAIQFFKNGINPCWEDPENEKGGDIQLEVPITSIDIYNQLYTEIIYEIIGQQEDQLRHVNGVRVLDKINAAKGNGIRIELWLDIDPVDTNEQVQNHIKKIDDWILQLAEKYDTADLQEIQFQFQGQYQQNQLYQITKIKNIIAQEKMIGLFFQSKINTLIKYIYNILFIQTINLQNDQFQSQNSVILDKGHITNPRSSNEIVLSSPFSKLMQKSFALLSNLF